MALRRGLVGARRPAFRRTAVRPLGLRRERVDPRVPARRHQGRGARASPSRRSTGTKTRATCIIGAAARGGRFAACAGSKGAAANPAGETARTSDTSCRPSLHTPSPPPRSDTSTRGARRRRASGCSRPRAPCCPTPTSIGLFFGVRYGDLLGHRGLSHSLAFAAAVGVAVSLIFFRDARAADGAFADDVGTLLRGRDGVARLPRRADGRRSRRRVLRAVRRGALLPAVDADQGVAHRRWLLQRAGLARAGERVRLGVAARARRSSPLCGRRESC